MRKQFNHLELQFVMDFGAEDITEILNIFANRVSKGEKFKPGQIVEIGNYRYRFDESSYNGESFLRIVITDDNGKFPEDKDCEELHTFQLIKTEDLYFKNQIGGTTND